jgi:hypothetical protein
MSYVDSEEAARGRIEAIDQGVGVDEYCGSGFRSAHYTLVARYSYAIGLRFPRNSGVTGRLSKQEVQWLIGGLRMQAAMGNEMAGVVAERLAIWQKGKTQEEAREYMHVSVREIKELDRVASQTLGCRMYPMPYNPEPLTNRKRRYRSKVVSAILRRMFSTKLRRKLST